MDNNVDLMYARLKQARIEAGLTQPQVAKRLNFTKGSVSRLETGYVKKIKAPVIEVLATLYGVNPAWLMGYENVPKTLPAKTNDKNILLIPVVGKVSAGNPIVCNENIIGYLPIDPDMIHSNSVDGFFFLKVQGNSMNKRFVDGSYILVKQQHSVENDEIAVVLLDDEVTVKRFKTTDSPQFVTLLPDSTYDEYIPTIVNLKDSSLIILGKVIGNLNMNI